MAQQQDRGTTSTSEHKKERKQMPSYKVVASKTIYLSTIIQADTQAEAEHLAKQLYLDDFTTSSSVAFNLDGVTEMETSNG